MPQKRRSKYGATPTTVDGITFHSAKEARRYGELKLLEYAGEIRGLRLQPEFTLCPWKADHSDIRVIGKYVGDFAYEERMGEDGSSAEWTLRVEDVKGFKTPLYRWKQKHFEVQYGITIRET